MQYLKMEKISSWVVAVMALLTLALSYNPAYAEEQPKLAFYVEFNLKPEYIDEWKQGALGVIEKMSKEDTFVSAYMHRDANDPNKFTLYEVWSESSREAFFENQLNAKDYRKEYEENLPKMLTSPRSITFLDLLKEWHQ
ncbi:antibiotic biosynthesis monooxygenase [Photobacterium sp. SDRW27]|uniref:putative quinol monooxygenase n=1 Tax=Photobacterium obscurum TaxID=2829490 RepID=UPI002243CBD7|nr:antibiotic biosynthesis monooxygenase [Photobacterium obscurum]MCW8327847.1 antibiotic biosynthesis monooxygenase [Photobacterium obscurum]